MIDWVRLRYWFYAITVLVVVVTSLALVVPPRLPWGLEFSSGSALTVEFTNAESDISAQDVRLRLSDIGLAESVVQESGQNAFFIRTTRVEDNLAQVLEERFGIVQTYSLEGASDLADIVWFTEPVPLEDLQNAFGENAVVSPTGAGSFFVSAQGVTQAQFAGVTDGLQSRFGPLESTSFDTDEGFAVLLDFGTPEVAENDVNEALEAISAGSFENTTTGANIHLIVGTGLSKEANDAVVPSLEERFGRSRQTTYTGDSSMALALTFEDDREVQDIRNELFEMSVFTAFVVPLEAENSFLLLAENIDQERQDTIVSTLRDKLGQLDRIEFGFDTGFAQLVDFGETVDLEGLRSEAGRIETGVIAAPTADEHVFFVGGAQVAKERRDEIVSSLEEGFGLAAQTPFDFANAVATQVTFTDPVSLELVIGNLAAVPVNDAVGGRASVRVLDINNLLIVGTALSPETQDRIRDAIEDEVGSFEVIGFDREQDLAITLDFGEAVTTADLRAEVSEVEPDGVAVESVSESTYFLGSADLSPERQRALLERIENQFGRARRSSFEGEDQLSLVLTFTDPVSIGEVRSEVAAQELTSLVVASVGSDAFFVGGSGVDEQAKDELLAALRDRFGALEERPFDFSVGMAISLDFGVVIDLEGVRTAVAGLGFGDVFVESARGEGFFVGARDVSQERRADLITGLEELFGLANQSPFDSPDQMAETIELSDPARAAEAVNDLLVAHKLGPNRFFLAASGIPEERQGQILAALQAGLGPLRQESYNFTEGVAANLTFPQGVSEQAIAATLEPFGYSNLSLDDRGRNTYFLRSDRPAADQKNKIVEALESSFGEVRKDALEFSFVDAEIARRSVLNTFWAVLAASVGILLYVWWAFRRAPKPFRYGVAALVGLVHDVLIVLGAFGIMAKFRGVEIDSLMIIGVLAVIGYSVNNTIVVLDRIRENLARNPSRSFEMSVNVSMNETLSRNLNTTATTTFAILAVLLFGGGTVFNFMLVLLIGILAGTYSSLYLAPNILVSWERGEIPRVRLPKFRRAPTGG